MINLYEDYTSKRAANEYNFEKYIDKEDSNFDLSFASSAPNQEEEKQRLRQQQYGNKILQLADFNQAFELVKSAVEEKFNMHRAGLSLILQGLPTKLGAYHVLGSNLIIVNKRILGIIKIHKSLGEYNSFLFMVLTHEYLHSLGIIDEIQVRKMTYTLLVSLVGEQHIATKMARHQPWDLFPELSLFNDNSFEQKFEIVKNFDKTTQSYIG
ncbi:MAG TPA: hypothetical protein VJ799_04780 [Nitrososphaeraceae archaeon]|jgi:hypothetical protein|nr:hypothetical protein [Nitrososphaeraceae archaeon]